MYTQKQQYLITELNDTRPEKEVRAAHKSLVKDGIAVKDFTTWLTKRLQRQWVSERSRIYLGD